MSIRVDVSVEAGRLGVSRALVQAAATRALRAAGVRSAILSVAFVGNRTMARLNRQHLGHAGTTDVISFGYPPVGPRKPLVGDIYIGVDVARTSARQRQLPLREELVRLVVHGALHVAGLDHPAGASRERSPMWNVQERVVKRTLAGRGG